ncbi:glutamine amidotransferase-related protein [Anaerosphaera multitolerans]|uniref:Glutamine amidotransferase n=1 Tax=Anaerosphaera multitolerans TaxID=2487351 RepID=A0A437S536_9FIRM|nr:gamma-glutamyl-gamma-aminobutyrate hydrolase family protein [Anaerosphaera multitolerans]RVU54121.1 hypothetical protein EF514_09050 [Anaerosphaera multitolerans]
MKKILIVDFGYSNPDKIAEKISDLANIYLSNYKNAYEKALEFKVDGIIFGGGISDIMAEDAPRVDKAIYDLGLPIFGICSGMELIALDFGGVVGRDKFPFEKGDVVATLDSNSIIFKNLPEKQHTHMYHGYSVEELPKNFINIGSTENGPIAAFENPELKLYGTIFHPEGKYSQYGREILKNFINSI